jgi:hypothetical protein
MQRTISKRLNDMADALQKHIDNGRRPMIQNPTPKRMREYASRIHDAGNMERVQKAMRALAAGHEVGTLPTMLSVLRTKDEILTLVRKSLRSVDCYHVCTENNYANSSPAAVALQALMESRMSPEDQAKADALKRGDDIRRLEDKVRFSDIPGFFPTPVATIARMFKRAAIEDGMSILEPSAGKGDILDYVAAKCPHSSLAWCERNYQLSEIIRMKHPMAASYGDFIDMPLGQFDRVLMNPPFERQQDIEHVRLAFEHLKPGGRLVAVVSAGTLSRNNRKTTEFRNWIEATGAEVEDLNSAFANSDAFRRTAIACNLVTISKPAEVMVAPRMWDENQLSLGRAAGRIGSRVVASRQTPSLLTANVKAAGNSTPSSSQGTVQSSH